VHAFKLSLFAVLCAIVFVLCGGADLAEGQLPGAPVLDVSVGAYCT
jgi:hypothetical protein